MSMPSTEQITRYRDFAECSVDCLWESDAELHVHLLPLHNRPHGGVGSEVLRGSSFPAACQELLKRREPFRDYECRVVDAAGMEQWLCLSGMPVFAWDGGFSGYRGVGRLITRNKQAEAALHERLRAAEQSAQNKAAFLASMSHEIRTPINAVMGFARMGWRDSEEPRQRDRWQRVLDAGGHLLAVVNDILDFSKLEAGKFRVEVRPFRLGHVIDNACAMVDVAAHQKGLNCSRDDECPHLDSWVLGDAQRLQQILANLLSNAVKFTDQGEVRLRVARDGDLTYFRVLDTGIGMSPQQVARLFQPFEQAVQTTPRHFGGTGLGLVISRELARLMGGDISVDSALGAGSAFTLCLPLAATAPESEHESAPVILGGQRLSGMRILAAEDMEVNRMVLQDLLESEGAVVHFAVNGREAVERWQSGGEREYDVVLMDIQMPEMDGLEAARRLLAQSPGLAIIGLTANAMPEERARCLEVGMCDHVTKPIEPDRLVAAILQAQQKRENTRSDWSAA